MPHSRSSGTSREERVPEPLPPNPYSALGVPENADSSVIRNAYRRLVLTYHPDRVADPNKKASSAERFRQVQEAYELLIDEVRLSEYKERVQSENQNATRSTPRHRESNRSSNMHRARSTSRERRSSNRDRSRNRSSEHRYYEEQHKASSHRSSPHSNAVEFPLRRFYMRCAICGDERCVHEHRWFTRLGYINNMTSRGVSLSGARAIAEERFGAWDDYETCEVCFGRGCIHPHRIFTREGFVWEQLRIRGDDSADAIVAARIRAREEFGFPSSYGAHRRPHEPPSTFNSSYSCRPLGSSWRDNIYDSVSYADELRQRRRQGEDMYDISYRTWQFV
jgi:DnaJ-domain-containing protein 1